MDIKVCLINPPSNYRMNELEEWSNNTLCNSSYLGIRYLEAALKAKNICVDVYDCPCEKLSVQSVSEILTSRNYTHIGISIFFYNLFNGERLLNLIKRKFPSTFVFVGGYAVTLDVKEVLQKHPRINCAFIGEGEETLVEFFENIINNRDWRTTSGIAYLEDTNVVINSKKSESNLDELPFPEHKLYNKSTVVSLMSSRGCYGDCSFCSEKQFNILNNTRGIRSRSVENVIEELKIILKNNKVKEISYADSNFLPATINRKRWMILFVNLLKKNNINIEARINTRANDIIFYEDLLDDMKSVGFRNFFVGIESFSQSQLDLYNKRISVEDNIKALKILINKGIKIEFGFLIFEPYSTIKEIRESINILVSLDILKNIDVNQEFFSVASKLFLTKGTQIYEKVYNDKLNYTNSLGYIFLHSDTKEYYDKIMEWAAIVEQAVYIRYLIEKCKYLDKVEESNKLYECFIKILDLDINMMKQLLDIYHDKTASEKLILDGEKKLKSILNKYVQVIEEAKSNNQN